MDASDHIPFGYRGSGRKLLGRPLPGDGTCRRGYGPPVFAECGSACVYCGREMGEKYESWLDLSIDHVIPRETIKRLGWPSEWIEDIANLVTCCRACNEFSNGHRVADPAPVTEDEFFTLHDRHFLAKGAWVIERHASERGWYEEWTRVRRPSPVT